MKHLSVLQLLAGGLLLVAAAFVSPSTDPGVTAPVSVAVAMHDVTGMAFGPQEPQEPELKRGICVQGGGGDCDPHKPSNYCQVTIFPIILGSGCGAAEGKYCGYITSGPFKDDACTTVGAPPESKCGLSPTGACAQVREGTCYSMATGSFFQCKCNYAAGNTTYNGRKVCVP